MVYSWWFLSDWLSEVLTAVLPQAQLGGQTIPYPLLASSLAAEPFLQPFQLHHSQPERLPALPCPRAPYSGSCPCQESSWPVCTVSASGSLTNQKWLGWVSSAVPVLMSVWSCQSHSILHSPCTWLWHQKEESWEGPLRQSAEKFCMVCVTWPLTCVCYVCFWSWCRRVCDSVPASLLSHHHHAIVNSYSGRV